MDANATTDPREMADEFEILRRELGVNSAAEMLERLKPAPTQESINGVGTASLELQLSSLYSQKEALTHELGVSHPEDILQMIEGLNTHLAALYSRQEERTARGLDDEFGALEGFEMQLNCLYSEREEFLNAVGAKDLPEVLHMLRSLIDQVQLLYADRENYAILDGNTIIIQGPRKVFVKKQ